MMYDLLISLILYLSYLELSPGLGNIWYRFNSNNVRCISIMGALNMIFYPLRNITFWYISNWDLNFFMYYFIIKILICVVKSYTTETSDIQ